ncbi:MAG: hypothetical protein RBU45_11255 [Myxococcota bacterium]|jgi:hypothetical protein|nr:hypothetical protein [Myxococcota bacterium]
MYIRYQHARNAALVLGFAGTLAYCCTRESPPSPAPVHLAAPVAAPRTPAAPVASATSAATPPGEGDLARELLVIQRASHQATPNEKVKDALSGYPWKVNLYEETGDAQYDRLKIDKNRDDTWDDSWTFKSGRWEKQGGYAWTGQGWTGPDGQPVPGAAAAAATPAPVAAAAAVAAPAAAADPLVRAAQELLTGRASGDKVKDLFRGAGPKVNLYDDDKDGAWDRAKVDADRNDDWEEKWTRKGGVLERKNEKTGKVLLFQGGGWVEK